QCTASDYVTVSWSVEPTPIAGSLAKTPDVLAVCENENVNAILTPGSGGNGTDETEYRTNDGTWSGWLTYNSGTDISTTGLSSVEIRSRRLASQCAASDYVTVSWEIQLKPTAYAGPNNIFCESDSYTLSGATASNYSSVLWTTSGDGYFDDPTIVQATYFPGNGDSNYGEVSLFLRANAIAPCDVFFSDMIVLDIQKLPSANAGSDAAICETDSFQVLDASADNYNSLLWTSSGTGSFDDPSILNPTYTPSMADRNNGGVQLVLTANSLTPCTTADSDQLTLTLNPQQEVSVSITADQTVVCDGTTVNFTAQSTNAGDNPLYEWTVNGTAAGGNSDSFSYVPADGDEVQLTLTSSLYCVVDAFATSNTITLTVNPIPEVSVSISASDNSICAGSMVTYTAEAVNGGDSPQYSWYVNGVLSGDNSSIFTYSPDDQDEVWVELTSNIACNEGETALSNVILMLVNPALEATVVITASNTSVCSGTAVSFTSEIENGGSDPSFEWTVNGIAAGSNSPSFSYVPQDLDEVQLTLTSNAICVVNSVVSSNIISINVTQSIEATAVISIDSNPV
ncbi:MAG: hypothetical protein K8F24_11240, partial [Bacteroidales bacterium]|nr:hypothetical protein [Bacteroidales bacterium]